MHAACSSRHRGAPHSVCGQAGYCAQTESVGAKLATRRWPPWQPTLLKLAASSCAPNSARCILQRPRTGSPRRAGQRLHRCSRAVRQPGTLLTVSSSPRRLACTESSCWRVLSAVRCASLCRSCDARASCAHAASTAAASPISASGSSSSSRAVFSAAPCCFCSSSTCMPGCPAAHRTCLQAVRHLHHYACLTCAPRHRLCSCCRCQNNAWAAAATKLVC